MTARTYNGKNNGNGKGEDKSKAEQWQSMRFRIPPIAMRLRWMGHPAISHPIHLV
jgi:hypothetical protein